MNKLFVCSIFLLVNIVALAQNDCYSPTKKEAINLFSKKQFKNAKAIFESAKLCPDRPKKNDLDLWINKCDEALNPKTRQATLTFAQKMALYEPVDCHDDFSEGLMPVVKKAEQEKYYKNYNESSLYDSPKVGFINEKGDVVIPFKYGQSLLFSNNFSGNCFSEGYANVIEFDDDSSWGWTYIDKKGNKPINEWFVDAYSFSEGIAAVSPIDLYDETDYLRYVFIRKDGTRINNESYMNVGYFSEGLCAVEQDSISGWGYIDVNGNLVIPYKYKKVNGFQNGRAYVFDDKHTFEAAQIDKTGRIVSDFGFCPDALSLAEIMNYIMEKHNKKEYAKAYIAMTSYEERYQSTFGENKIDSNVALLLGRYYYYGYGGVPKNANKAVSYWKKAEDVKCGAMYYLALMYEKGEGGLEQDYDKALEYYNKSINRGLAYKYDSSYLGDSYYNIGCLFFYGKGVTQSYVKAKEYFVKSKECDHPQAEAAIKACNAKM